MPNYSLVIDSKFKPFSFQDMLAPVAMAQAKHEQLEQQYGELLGDAEEWGSKIDRVNDPIAYARYKSFMDNLNANSGELSRHGLNRNSTKSLMNTRGYYRNRIKPIEEAWTTRKEQQAKFRDMIAQNPTLLYENNIMNASLDDYLNNPAYDWGRSYSGALITQQVADQLAPIAKALNNYGRGKSLDPFLITISQKYGISVDEARRLIQKFHDDPQSAIKEDNIISQIIKNTIDSTQIDSWNPAVRDAVKQRMYEYAGMAIPHAIGVDNVQFTPNQGAIMAQQHEYAKRLARQGGGGEKPKKQEVDVTNLKENTRTTNINGKSTDVPVYSFFVKPDDIDISHISPRDNIHTAVFNGKGNIVKGEAVDFDKIKNEKINSINVYYNHGNPQMTASTNNKNEYIISDEAFDLSNNKNIMGGVYNMVILQQELGKGYFAKINEDTHKKIIDSNGDLSFTDIGLTDEERKRLNELYDENKKSVVEAMTNSFGRNTIVINKENQTGY